MYFDVLSNLASWEGEVSNQVEPQPCTVTHLLTPWQCVMAHHICRRHAACHQALLIQCIWIKSFINEVLQCWPGPVGSYDAWPLESLDVQQARFILLDL